MAANLADGMLAPGDRIGDYEVEAVLGVGGMATVYRARHAFLDSRWALKVLDDRFRADPTVRRRFLDEARIQHTHLDHPNIVKVTGIVATEQHAALVMELIDGGNLEDELPRLRQRPDLVRRVMLGILDGVGHAHAAGIIHRDLKPANVLLQWRGDQLVPKLSDFGIAKLASELAAPGKKSTHGESRMGTLHYMSPEQIKRAKDVTPRSDIFSLGAVLYELATGTVAFGGDSDYEIMEGIVHGRYRPPAELSPDIDPGLARVITTALDPDPQRRFGSCAEMAAALTGAVPVRGWAPPPPVVQAPAAAAPLPASAPSRQAAPARPAPRVAPTVPGRSALLLLSAVLLAVGLYTPKWATYGDGSADTRAGLAGIDVCFLDECRLVEWSEVAGAHDVGSLAWLVMAGGLVVAVGALVTALSRRAASLAAGPLAIVAAGTAALVALFLDQLTDPVDLVSLELGYSGGLAFAGSVVAGATWASYPGSALRRLIRNL